jgi:hypothetical protein
LSTKTIEILDYVGRGVNRGNLSFARTYSGACVQGSVGPLEGRQCLLLAFGAHKAAAVAAAVEGPVTSMVPASALQMHPDAKVYVDEPAAAKLTMRDYYDHAFRNSPVLS